MKYLSFSTPHMPRIVGVLLLTFFLFAAGTGMAQQCKGSFSVEKNRNSRSADEDGALFWLALENASSKSQTYTISYKMLKESCATSDFAKGQSNVVLDVKIGDAQKGVSNYTVRPGQTSRVKVLVTVPKGTPINRWSCIELQAFSEECSGTPLTTTLNVFVPDPSEG